MITVFPEKDKKIIGEHFEKAGLTATEQSKAVTAKLDGEPIGYCIFEIKDGTVTVFDIEPKDDIMLADGILRSALHVAAERFVFRAEYKEGPIEELLEKIAFIKDKSEHTVDMDKLFGGCCCGEKT